MESAKPVLTVAVAAALAGLHPQTLRQYDRLGLLCPKRSEGGFRRYNFGDIERLKNIASLVSAGVSLEGVRRIIRLERRIEGLEQKVARLQSENQRLAGALPGRRIFAADVSGDVHPLPPGVRVRSTKAVVLWLGQS